MAEAKPSLWEPCISPSPMTPARIQSTGASWATASASVPSPCRWRWTCCGEGLRDAAGEGGRRVVRGSCRLSCSRSRGPPRSRHLADSRIPGEDALAGSQGRLLEIRSICRKDLPARYTFSQYLNRSHVRELAAQTFVVIFGSRQPHPVVCRFVALVAEYENNLVRDVDREAAEHGASRRRQRGEGVEHELMRNGLALLDGEGVVQREKGHDATALRHRAHPTFWPWGASVHTVRSRLRPVAGSW